MMMDCAFINEAPERDPTLLPPSENSEKVGIHESGRGPPTGL